MKVGQLGPGEIIGEISWLDRKPISATVRAVETSSVLALSIAALERKIAADPGFAARLFRAIATLAAERLRTTTSQVRRTEHGAQSAAPAGSAPAAAVLDKIASLKRLVAAEEGGTGPVPDQAASQIRDAFAAVEQATHPEGLQNADKLADRLQTELLPLVRLSATGERCFAQPRGYAGDYQTIGMIYANQPAGTGRVGPVLDSCVLNLAAAKAIRNRRQRAGFRNPEVLCGDHEGIPRRLSGLRPRVGDFRRVREGRRQGPPAGELHRYRPGGAVACRGARAGARSWATSCRPTTAT